MPSRSEPARRSDPGSLWLRPPSVGDEADARAAHRELEPDGFAFLHYPELPWAEQLDRLRADAAGDLPAGSRWVPATFLVAEVEGVVVGRASIRHELNAWLLEIGGHIGYAVRPAYRRRGYATQILSQCLDRCPALGLDEVLVTCDDDNLGSRRAIERCGGVLEDVREVAPGAPLKRRYWFDLR